MATSSILGGNRAPIEPTATDDDSLGPSDSSDSGSDALGTGDRASDEAGLDEPTNSDILPDRIGVFPDDGYAAPSAVIDPNAPSVDKLGAETDPEDGATDGSEYA